jgi:rubredoxin
MADQGVTLEVKDDVVYLSGVMDESADLSSLLNRPEPLSLNFKGIKRFNSTGIRNLLRFLSHWGSRKLEYLECPCEFIDQINMIPALLGHRPNFYTIKSLFVPYECRSCSYDDEQLQELAAIEPTLRDGKHLDSRVCPQCGASLQVISEAYFAFLQL